MKAVEKNSWDLASKWIYFVWKLDANIWLLYPFYGPISKGEYFRLSLVIGREDRWKGVLTQDPVHRRGRRSDGDPDTGTTCRGESRGRPTSCSPRGSAHPQPTAATANSINRPIQHQYMGFRTPTVNRCNSKQHQQQEKTGFSASALGCPRNSADTEFRGISPELHRKSLPYSAECQNVTSVDTLFGTSAANCRSSNSIRSQIHMTHQNIC